MSKELLDQVSKIADALDLIAQSYKNETPEIDFSKPAFIWDVEIMSLRAIDQIDHIDIELLQNISHQKEQLMSNSLSFAKGYVSNNALLWGARGMGKSSLTKACFMKIHQVFPNLKLIEIQREDIATLPKLMRILKSRDERFILYCDDLSFDVGDDGYKSLKAVLEGGIEGRPANVLFYATSNRRHLLPREMIENEQLNAINARDTIDEKTSLSDRFGLWIGFHNNNQADYLEIVSVYAKHYEISLGEAELYREALQWAMGRGFSGRIASQFINHLAAQHNISIK